MPHPLDYKIREQLADYLAGKISLREFEDWLFSETWDRDDADNQALTTLVYGIKLRLAEFSHGDWKEAELRSLLRSILEKHIIVIENTIPLHQSQITYGTSSKNYSLPMPVIYSGRHVGISSSTVYV